MKRSELKQIIREEYAKVISESDVTKSLDKAVSTYQRLLKQKQDMIEAIRVALMRERDPHTKQQIILQHNNAIKKLNSQIDFAEHGFNVAVDKIEYAGEDQLI